jgi:hypothetical protein
VHLEDRLGVPHIIDEIVAARGRGEPFIAIWRAEHPIQVCVALLRHELEHACQIEVHGEGLLDLYDLTMQVLNESTEPKAGQFYHAVPMERDANEAASGYAREVFGDEVIDALVVGEPESAPMLRLPGGGSGRFASGSHDRLPRDTRQRRRSICSTTRPVVPSSTRPSVAGRLGSLDRSASRERERLPEIAQGRLTPVNHAESAPAKRLRRILAPLVELIALERLRVRRENGCAMKSFPVVGTPCFLRAVCAAFPASLDLER